MPEIPPIERVMIHAPVSVDVGDSLRVAQDRMIDHEIRHLPVTEKNQLVGIVSDRDVASHDNDPGSSGRSDELRVRDVCTFDCYTVEPDAPLDTVLMEMAERRIGSAVVARGSEVAGLFTATDACRCFAEYLRGSLGTR